MTQALAPWLARYHAYWIEALSRLREVAADPQGGLLTDEVLAHVRALLTADPSLRTNDLVGAIADLFGVRVHPRSVERALARQPDSKSD